jgi:hypothetical protein
MHPSYVGSRSHFHKTCLKMRCFYVNEFIDVLKSKKLNCINFMLIHSISMMVLFSVSSLLLLNIEMNNCPSLGFHIRIDFYLVLYLAFNIGGQNNRFHYCGGSNGAYGHGCIHLWAHKWFFYIVDSYPTIKIFDQPRLVPSKHIFQVL